MAPEEQLAAAADRPLARTSRDYLSAAAVTPRQEPPTHSGLSFTRIDSLGRSTSLQDGGKAAPSSSTDVGGGSGPWSLPSPGAAQVPSTAVRRLELVSEPGHGVGGVASVAPLPAPSLSPSPRPPLPGTRRPPLPPLPHQSSVGGGSASSRMARTASAAAAAVALSSPPSNGSKADLTHYGLQGALNPSSPSPQLPVSAIPSCRVVEVPGGARVQSHDSGAWSPSVGTIPGQRGLGLRSGAVAAGEFERASGELSGGALSSPGATTTVLDDSAQSQLGRGLLLHSAPQGGVSCGLTGVAMLPPPASQMAST
jgi:hypothetical protein